ncbi:hypothetical protein F5X98DRAFT_337912 [Xylaria grammica]|nr:hypothetical protein F5X98DRAFT_337912 [Xylaria grammica]
MASLNLHFDGYREGDGDLATALSSKTFSLQHIFLILRAFLQSEPSVSFHSAASALINMLPEDPSSTETWEVGELFLELAEQIPYNHPSHVKLARLLEHIGPSVKLGQKTHIPGRGQIWHRFQRLGESLLDQMPSVPESRDDMAYVNYHAFAANLCEFRIFPTDPTHSIWAMRDAFEKKLEEESHQMIRVMAAAQWIRWNGQGLFKQVLWHSEPTPDGERDWARGNLFEGKTLLGLDRWTFWRVGFQEAAGKENYTAEARAVAKGAAELMENIERCMST